MFGFPVLGWTAPDPVFGDRGVGRRYRLYRRVKRRHDFAGLEDWLLGWRGTPWKQQIAILVGAPVSALVLGPILITLNEASTVYQHVAADGFFRGFRVREDSSFCATADEVKIRNGPAVFIFTDTNCYRVWHNTDTKGGVKAVT